MTGATQGAARLAGVIDAGLFFVAALMCFSILYSPLGPIAVIGAASLVTALRLAAGKRAATGRRMRTVGWLAWLGNGTFHLFACYLTVVCASRLAWAMSWRSTAVAALLFAGALATLRQPVRGVRIPLALSAGVIILTCLLGWVREEGVARCDDYLRTVRQPGVTVLFPPADALADCRPGEIFGLARFPRKIWESPDSRRYVITTTQAPAPPSGVGVSAGPYDGLFCETSTDGSGRPRCLGGTRGKAHQIDDIEPLGQLFSCAWGLPSPDGRRMSGVFRLSREAPLTILQMHPIEDDFIMYGFYEPQTDEYHAFSDQCGPVRTLRGSDFAVLPNLPVATCPAVTLYDPQRDEGVMCGGLAGFAAFRLFPWSYRFIGREGNPIGRWSLSWGCDWDPAGRKVYALVVNLGVLAVIDYDSGRVEHASFVGFGLRLVAFDARRRLVYLADFLGGDVRALDADSGIERTRWFVGHYVRELRLSRDGQTLLTTSNLGIVRINLDTV